jgi:hypothetical protein
MGRKEFRPLGTGPEALYRERTLVQIRSDFEEAYPNQGYRVRKLFADAESEKRDLVILTKGASAELMNHVHWGVNHPNNLYEQQMGLAGYVFKDPDTARFITVVEYVVPAIAKNRTPVGARLTADDTADVQVEVNVMNRNRKEAWKYGVYTKLWDADLVGWGHTHPGQLDVFLSPTDRDTHRTLYGRGKESLGISLVVNPHRRLAAAFGGPQIREMGQIWFLSEGDCGRFAGQPAEGAAYAAVPERGRVRYEREAPAYRERHGRPGAENGGRATADKIERALRGETDRIEREIHSHIGHKTQMRTEANETIMAPAGGTWPSPELKVPEGGRGQDPIRCGDIVGGSHYEDAREYYGFTGEEMAKASFLANLIGRIMRRR